MQGRGRLSRNKIPFLTWSPQASLFTAVWANGSAYLDAVALLTAVRAFPAHRGLLVGILKSCFGLSASVLTEVYATFFQPDVTSFLLFLAIALPGTAALSSLALRLPPPGRENGGGDPNVPRRLGVLYALTTALAITLIGTSIAVSQNLLGGGARYAASGVVAALLLALLTFPLWQRALSVTAPGDKPRSPGSELLLASSTPGPGRDDDDDDSVSQGSGQDATLPKALLTFDYWLIFVICALGMGAGLTAINNVAQVYHALRDTAATAASGAGDDGAEVYVSVLSGCNCVGRMAAGAISDLLRRRASRPMFLVASCAAMGVGMLGLATTGIRGLLPFCVVTGLAYGSFWALLPTLVSELYGLTHFGALYSFQAFAPSLGSVLLSEQLTSRLYERHVLAGSSNCYGRQCFHLAFLLLAAGCALAVALSLLLWARTRRRFSDTTALVADDFRTEKEGRVESPPSPGVVL